MMTSSRLMFAFLLAVVGCACGDSKPKREWRPEDHGQPVAPDQDREPGVADDRPAEDPTVRAARALWNTSCAGCHARDGRGGGPGLPPGAKTPDLTAQELQSNRTDEQLAAVIRDGRNMMPAFGTQLNPEGVRALVAHVRTLAAPAQPAAPEAAPPSP
jgi:mono/diheme cytochrome c family protein